MKPILFNTEMVRKILSGEKTVTRRVIKKQPRGKLLDPASHYVFVWNSDIRYPPYVRGDVLYIRETWRVGAWDIPRQLMAFDYADGTCGELVHIEDREMFLRLVDQSREDARKAKCEYNGADFVWKKGQAPTRWRPSIHMPKEAARIFLRVTEVRAEGLQDITEEGAIKEGLYRGWRHTSQSTPAMTARQAFMWLWDSIVPSHSNKSYRWADNPWVWVIEFERCERPKEG